MEAISIYTSVDFGAGFWKKDRKRSGKEVDHFRGQNIPHNSKTIDRTVMLDCIVSHKSTDIRCKSYQRSNVLYRLGMHFVMELSNYRGEIRQDHKIGATYHLGWALENPSCRRILEWFIPDCSDVGKDHIIHRIVQDANAKGVEVIVYKVLDYD